MNEKTNYKGFSESKRGNWFSNRSTAVLWVNKTYQEVREKKDNEFYIINEQEGHLIRVREDKQIELLYNCLYGVGVDREEINWLIEKSGLKYFDNVQDYINKNPEKGEL